MEVSPEKRNVISLLRYLKVQLRERGEDFSIQPYKVEDTGKHVWAQNEEEVSVPQ